MPDESSENDVESETESKQSDPGSASDNGDEEGDDKSTNTSENANKNPVKKPKRVTLPQQGFKENIGGYKKYFSQSRIRLLCTTDKARYEGYQRL